ncbi:helix-turn-helix domain-containing protein [Paraburkholderia aspalathi]|uniref:helix-turn-helix domain-containing protein n=1 Tax=Paraburkholderia aspalathi TaxID=1324617 RepID=UPI001B0A5EB4|nr:AraC family transcriptional regulator [Paraburkholderia aspalathi]CAE6703394.1 HTH-type transcriptional activator RhaR [Paraburkholderia aspalathi]CAE6842525.1 HTH-type transcriptional activator RhaR [Paraburkholderia aspalathi]
MASSLLPYPETGADIAPQRIASSIDAEHQWRCRRTSHAQPRRQPGNVPVSRWTRNITTPLEVVNHGNESDHCIGLALKCTSLTFNHAGRRLIQGRVNAGVAQVTAPAVSVSAVFESSVDGLHLFASQQVLAECYEDLFQRPHAGDIVLGDPKLIRDPVLDRLGQALAVSQTCDAALGKVFTESVSLAIVSRIVAHQFTAPNSQNREGAALPQWRMNRVVEYIDAHLSETIGLADIAASAGLTRMHFAAQFRRATGLRPHEYLLRRRIEHAQHLLLNSKHNVLDVALSCGFRSQAHFTTVFKRFAGETPCCWRMKANGAR